MLRKRNLKVARNNIIQMFGFIIKISFCLFAKKHLYSVTTANLIPTLAITSKQLLFTLCITLRWGERGSFPTLDDFVQITAEVRNY